MFQIGDFVTPKSKSDVNFGRVGKVVRLSYEEVYVDFGGVVCLYFKWMVCDV